ncbi:hypothetical protein CERSUDRAFT_68862 [Gelatoporia subvermispora B]|uniref:Halogenase n=1 Tax=Ceriporiopsis subvermispora (strain B) TaxID=914234 RepID=M2Q634_CERS8|nr:hypothetical protein CERSUDRAFT_68862 [Gelatoporia subvermispora B]
MASSVPSSTQILVIGGGPAGSYAASALSREGFKVVLLESARFPRYHIGESLLPSARPFLRLIDAETTVGSYGFTRKPGAAFRFNRYKREGYTDFMQGSPDEFTWNVTRSDFDHLLLKHARTCGVTTIEGTRVTEIHFSSVVSSRPIAASWKNDAGAQGGIAFDYLVDASGRNGLMSTRYLKNRHFNASLRNMAYWGYWEGAGMYMPGTARENAVFIEALEDESGWAWFTPLHDGTTSIGIVIDHASAGDKKSTILQSADGHINTSQKLYLQEVIRAPGIKEFIAHAMLREINSPNAVKTASDYSYAAASYGGDHFRIAGDAGAFIDPFFSTGVHLAFVGALSAAITISTSIRGTVTEELAVKWHNTRVSTSYTRFLLVVLGTYRQIREQNVPILSDIDEDNFDRAFNILRPVIQGRTDFDRAVSESELEKTMEFCAGVFAPTDEQNHAKACARLDPLLTSSDGPIVSMEVIDNLTASEDMEARFVAHKLNARRVIHTAYDPLHNFGVEVLHGLRAVTKRGHLQLEVVED